MTPAPLSDSLPEERTMTPREALARAMCVAEDGDPDRLEPSTWMLWLAMADHSIEELVRLGFGIRPPHPRAKSEVDG